MRPGAFFKMVDSPFRVSMMSAYGKMQDKTNKSVFNGNTGKASCGSGFEKYISGNKQARG